MGAWVLKGGLVFSGGIACSKAISGLQVVFSGRRAQNPIIEHGGRYWTRADALFECRTTPYTTELERDGVDFPVRW